MRVGIQATLIICEMYLSVAAVTFPKAEQGEKIRGERADQNNTIHSVACVNMAVFFCTIATEGSPKSGLYPTLISNECLVSL